MVGSIGLPEIFILLFVGAIWVIPIAVAVWAVVMLQQIRTSQRIMQAAIERLLQR